jgi:predicted MFS family arabinose efflux permease
VSFQEAVRNAERIGLLRTMVFTHLPSNVLLVAVPFAPSLATGVALLLGRFLLSQMDVPARQAYVVAVVQPHERTAAAAYTHSAPYAARPLATILAGAHVQASTLAAPFVIAGTLKSCYDVAFWRMFRRVPIGDERDT